MLSSSGARVPLAKDFPPSFPLTCFFDDVGSRDAGDDRFLSDEGVGDSFPGKDGMGDRFLDVDSLGDRFLVDGVAGDCFSDNGDSTV